jgi:hypothetical protein
MSTLRACLGNGGFKWMEEDWRGFWKFWLIVEIPPPQCPSFPFIPLIPKQALRWRYAPNITASNSLQLPESQISCLYLKNTKHSKTTKIEGLPTGFEGQDHQEKRHTNLMYDSKNKSRKETSPKPSHENPKKRLQKSPKKTKGKDTIKPWGTTPNHLYIPWSFIQGLACLPIIHPSLKISP